MTRILIVDDHAVVRRGLQAMLAHEFPEANIGEASHATGAAQQLASQAWEIVLLDVNLPGRSGFEILTEIRRLHPQTRVLILSSYPEEEFALRAFQLGADAYLNKQSAADELLTAIRHVLAGGKYVTAALGERIAAALGSKVGLAPHEVLSNRELQVLRLIAMGRTLKEIAAELFVSEKTVATYRARISEKMGVNSKVELTRYALKHGLVD